MKLRTKLSVADCKARLGSATDLPGLAFSWDSPGAGAVVGEFRGCAFRLHTRNFYRNSFAPFFYGKLTEEAGGDAILEGAFGMNPLVRLCMLFWLSFLLLFGLGAIIVPAQAHPAISFGRGWFFTGLVLLAVLGVGFVQLGHWLGRGEKKVIHSFLKSALEADDA